MGGFAVGGEDYYWKIDYYDRNLEFHSSDPAEPSVTFRVQMVMHVEELWHTRRLSHRFIERLIGTLRREYLDHVFFWNANNLERQLERFLQYYNAHRVHTPLSGDTPSETAGEAAGRRAALNQFQWKSHCRRLYQLPVAA